MRSSSLFVGVWFTLIAARALAADAPPSEVVRGTIARLDAKSVTIAKPDGTTITAALDASTVIGVVEPRHFQQINSADFVGITTVPGPGDSLTAKEIHIFPLKGVHEGSFPWSHPPSPAAASTSTNGTVSAIHDDPAAYTMTNASVTASSLGKLTVAYRGAKLVDGKCTGRAADAVGPPCNGVATVSVPSSTPIIAIVPGRLADAKVGLAVFAIFSSRPKHEWAAASLTVEKNGVKPAF
jgi:hypothetical protein